MMKTDNKEVPIEPFQRFIEERIQRYKTELNFGVGGIDENKSIKDANPISLTARDLGWHGETGLRRLHRYRYGQKHTKIGKKTVTVNVTHYSVKHVEEALFNAGLHLWDIYPKKVVEKIYPYEYSNERPEQLYCSHCDDISFVDEEGLCMWCDKQLKLVEKKEEIAA